jgi:hypothetical protein
MEREDEVNEYPILFGAEMIRAILDRRKTQTRRVIRNLSGTPDFFFIDHNRRYPYYYRRVDAVWDSFKTVQELVDHRCPYGKPGDRLWVRETWSILGCEDVRPSQIKPGWRVLYAADDPKLEGDDNWRVERWRPSIYMCRWMSRITLGVLDIHPERVQDISHQDAVEEGLYCYHENYECALDHFPKLWDSINAKRGYSFESNPWVWVIKFEVL